MQVCDSGHPAGVLPACSVGFRYIGDEQPARLCIVTQSDQLDDIGTEEVSNVYGNKRLAFAEIMDSAEKYGKLVIVSSNLTVAEIKKRYGDRVLDRVVATTKRVLFEGGKVSENKIYND